MRCKRIHFAIWDCLVELMNEIHTYKKIHFTNDE